MATCVLEIEDLSSGAKTEHSLDPRVSSAETQGSQAIPVSIKYRQPLAMSSHPFKGREGGYIVFSRSTLNLAILSQVQTSLNPRSASAARPFEIIFDNLDEQIKLGLVTLSDTSLESAAGKKFAFTRLNPKRAVSTEQGFAAKLPEDSYLRSSGRQASLKDICGRLGDEFTKQVAWKVDPNGADVLFGLVTVSEKGHENVKFGLSIRRLTSIAPDAVDTGEVSPSALTVGDDTEMSGM